MTDIEYPTQLDTDQDWYPIIDDLIFQLENEINDMNEQGITFLWALVPSQLSPKGEVLSPVKIEYQLARRIPKE